MKDYRVQEETVEFDFQATGTEVEVQAAIEGEVKQIHLVVPNFTNAVTLTLSVLSGTHEIFNSGAKAKGASYNFKATELDQSLLVVSTMKFKATLSGDAGGAGGTAKVVILYKGQKG